jgi:excinuclease ABC subunit C
MIDLNAFPTQPGVYLMKNGEGTILYIGKAKQLKQRIKQYFIPGRDGRVMVPILTAQVVSIETIVVPTEKEALLLENTLIKRHQPKFNVLLKDDKTFISLMINHKHPWPMIRLIRYKGVPKEEGLYFGPYTNAFAARQTFELLTRIFPLRQCSDEELKRRTRPCLLYSIKCCIAPCAHKCSKEEYQEFVKGAIHFLRGQNKQILKELKKEMEHASENLEFEKAAALLKTIRQIEDVLEHDKLAVRASKDCDALGLYREGHEVMLVQLIFREGNLVGSEHYSFEKIAEEDPDIFTSFILQNYKDKKNAPKELLVPIALQDAPLLEEIVEIEIHTPHKGEKRTLIDLALQNAKVLFNQEKDHQGQREKLLLDLATALKLNRYPKRIECFDTSNISGSDLVACMIAYTDGEKDKKRRRLFKIRDLHKGDDYAALHQVLTRRLIRAKEEEDLPDLILIDGGKGQLNIALDVFKELDIATIDAIALAKEEGRHDKGIRLEKVFLPHQSEPIHFEPRSPLLFFLQKIRDDTHQTAISFHRKRREKRVIRSALDEIPGIGAIKRTRLLRHFGSIEKLYTATDEEILSVKGITRKDLDSIRHKSRML